jgi:hypothetical protein
VSTPFWLYTPLRHSKGQLPPIVLHLAGCGKFRLVKNKAWTGPLGWDELALIPVESYRLCPCCRNLCSTPPAEPSRKILHYGPRRSRSHRNGRLAPRLKCRPTPSRRRPSGPMPWSESVRAAEASSSRPISDAM